MGKSIFNRFRTASPWITNFIKIAIIAYLFFVIVVRGTDYPENFFITILIVALYVVFNNSSKEIKDLREQIKEKDKKWREVEEGEKFKALKRLEKEDEENQD